MVKTMETMSALNFLHKLLLQERYTKKMLGCADSKERV